MNETERVALSPCPFCGDPMRGNGELFQHTAQAQGCILLANAWPAIPSFITAWNARAAIAAMPERAGDPFMVDNFAAMWTDWADADWQLVTDPTTFLEQCEDAGLAECVEVDDDALDDAFAAERGIEPGGMMWRLTDAGRERYAAPLPTPPEAAS